MHSCRSTGYSEELLQPYPKLPQLGNRLPVELTRKVIEKEPLRTSNYGLLACVRARVCACVLACVRVNMYINRHELTPAKVRVR